MTRRVSVSAGASSQNPWNGSSSSRAKFATARRGPSQRRPEPPGALPRWPPWRGDESGILKLLIHQKDRTILGVHCLGTGATELIHIGQMIMTFQGTVDVLLDNVFNYPTLAYKVAAHNGVNKLTLL